MNEDAAQKVLQHQASKFFGKYRGTVADNNDPLTRGRLSVQIPQVLGDAAVWALPCVPYAGKDVGFFAMPPVGTMVWIEFEAGDPSYPIWVGMSWALGDITPADGTPDIKFWKTDKFTIRIDDAAGEIVISNQGGSQIKLAASEIDVKSSEVKVDASGGFSVNDTSLQVQ
jgi:uncharacterized protein involved in type VI secretion and phage assembly